MVNTFSLQWVKTGNFDAKIGENWQFQNYDTFHKKWDFFMKVISIAMILSLINEELIEQWYCE